MPPVGVLVDIKILVAASRSPAANWAFSETCVLLGRPYELRRAATKLRARQRAISIKMGKQGCAAVSRNSQNPVQPSREFMKYSG